MRHNQQLLERKLLKYLLVLMVLHAWLIVAFLSFLTITMTISSLSAEPKLMIGNCGKTQSADTNWNHFFFFPNGNSPFYYNNVCYAHLLSVLLYIHTKFKLVKLVTMPNDKICNKAYSVMWQQFAWISDFPHTELSR